MKEIIDLLKKKRDKEIAKSILESNTHNGRQKRLAKLVLNEEEQSKRIFKVGDVLEWSGLYGGSYTGKVLKIQNGIITLDVSWTSEDTGDDLHTNTKYEIVDDGAGNEVFIVWEYRGEKGYVYPPENEVDPEEDLGEAKESVEESSSNTLIESSLSSDMYPKSDTFQDFISQIKNDEKLAGRGYLSKDDIRAFRMYIKYIGFSKSYSDGAGTDYKNSEGDTISIEPQRGADKRVNPGDYNIYYKEA